MHVCCQVQRTRPSGCCAACWTHVASIHLLMTLIMHLHVQHTATKSHEPSAMRCSAWSAQMGAACRCPNRNKGRACEFPVPHRLHGTYSAPVLQHKARQFMYSRQLLECCFIGGLVSLGSTAPTACTTAVQCYSKPPHQDCSKQRNSRSVPQAMQTTASVQPDTTRVMLLVTAVQRARMPWHIVLKPSKIGVPFCRKGPH